MKRLLAVAAVLCVCACAVAGTTAAAQPTPVFAYYHIWFEATSWDRAKRDFPLLGRYSSDERRVMRQHVRWAKQAGIDGFIVSWKSAWRLNRRLEYLATIAAAEGFQLAIMYQGLDFEREPLPVDRIATDLDFFITRFAGRRAFTQYDRPLVIWSGTWRFRASDIARVTGPRRRSLLLLASEKNIPGYERVRAHVDGNAYYWSSVNPDRHPRYRDKLVAMSRRVHEDGGLWIAPAAPGFDARLVGGSSVVPRHDGRILRERLDAAASSSPDLIGIISWNEFSENTHIEPSERYGSRALEVVSDVLGASFVTTADLDSSEPATGSPASDSGFGIPFLIGITSIALAVVGVAWRALRQQANDDGNDDEAPPRPAGAGASTAKRLTPRQQTRR